MLAASGIMALLVPTLAAYGHDPVSIVALLASMWPLGLLGHYLIGVIDQKIGTKKTTVLVVVLQAVDFLIVAAFGDNYAICAIAIGLLMFAISGNANVCMSMTTSVFGRAAESARLRKCAPSRPLFPRAGAASSLSAQLPPVKKRCSA